jgi:hypothetical protein
MVSKVFGYVSGSGFVAESVTSQKCNAGMSLRLLYRYDQRMHLHSASNPKIHGKDFRSTSR